MLKENSILLMVMKGLFEYLLLFPLFVIVGVFIIPTELLWIWFVTLPCLFLLGLLCRKIFSKQSWWIYAVYSLIFGILSSVVFDKHVIFIILIAVIHSVIIYRGIMYIGRPWEDLLPISFIWIGGPAIYFVSYFFFRYVSHLQPYLHIITICGLVMLTITMFVSNSDHLRSSTLSKDRKPFISRTIKHQNRVFLVLTIGFIFLMANAKVIKDGLWNTIRSVIQWIFSLSSGTEEEIIEEPPPADLSSPFPMEEEKEASFLAELLDLIMTYVMYVVIAIGVIIFILLLIKKTREIILNAVQKLIDFLKRLGNQLSRDSENVQYVDEKENVFDWQEWREEQQEKVKGFVKNIFKRKPNWDSLSNDEQVRFIYKQFLSQQKMQDYDASETPREMIKKIQESTETGDEILMIKLRDAYEQVRYGKKEINQTTIQEIYTLIQEK